MNKWLCVFLSIAHFLLLTRDSRLCFFLLHFTRLTGFGEERGLSGNGSWAATTGMNYKQISPPWRERGECHAMMPTNLPCVHWEIFTTSHVLCEPQRQPCGHSNSSSFSIFCFSLVHNVGTWLVPNHKEGRERKGRVKNAFNNWNIKNHSFSTQFDNYTIKLCSQATLLYRMESSGELSNFLHFYEHFIDLWMHVFCQSRESGVGNKETTWQHYYCWRFFLVHKLSHARLCEDHLD